LSGKIGAIRPDKLVNKVIEINEAYKYGKYSYKNES
jgi:hypothetical protein